MNLHFSIPPEIIHIIRDMAFDTPMNNYKLVMKELKKNYCHPTCGDSCFYKAEFIEGAFRRRPIFITQCFKRCSICNSKVSRDFHTLCHACAEKGSMEFSYHHNICPASI